MSRTPIELPTTHGDVRSRLNENTVDLHRVVANGRLIYCESTYTPPAGVTMDGSYVSPFNQINVALEELNTTGGGAIVLAPANYSFGAGTLDLPPNSSLINLYGRRFVTFTTSIITENTTARLERIQIRPSYELRIGSLSGVGLVEQFTVTECELFGSTGQFHGGDSGNDDFLYNETIFGLPTGANIRYRFTGTQHTIDTCRFEVNTIPTFGIESVQPASPATSILVSNCQFRCPSTLIEAYQNQTTTIKMTNCDFLGLIVFDIGANASVLLELDLSTYDELIRQGTDFDVVGLAITVMGASRFYSDTNIITPVINDDPLQDVCELSAGGLIVGETYQVEPSFIWNTNNVAADSVEWEFDIDGAPVTPLFSRESSDPADAQSWNYALPIVAINTTMTFTLKARVATALETADIQSTNIMLERKYGY